MALLNEGIQKQVKEAFKGLQNPVKLVMFTQADGGALECQMCADTRTLIEELGQLSDKISVQVYDFLADKEIAEHYAIDKIPAVVIEGDQDYGIRFYGIPSGYEFSSLIEDIRMVAARQPNLLPETMTQLGKLNRPVHLQVFVTPT